MSHCSWLRLPMTSAICRRKARSRRQGTCPSTEASPAVGNSRPESIFRVVVLPAPLGPRKPTTSPAATSKETPATASTSRWVRANRPRTAARSPSSRTGTTKVLRRSATWTSAAGGGTGWSPRGRRGPSNGRRPRQRVSRRGGRRCPGRRFAASLARCWSSPIERRRGRRRSRSLWSQRERGGRQRAAVRPPPADPGRAERGAHQGPAAGRGGRRAGGHAGRERLHGRLRRRRRRRVRGPRAQLRDRPGGRLLADRLRPRAGPVQGPGRPRHRGRAGRPHARGRPDVRLRAARGRAARALSGVVRIRNGRVTAVLRRRPGATELRVAVDGEPGEATSISYDQVTGPVDAGDRVVLNTTAVALGLGTGGFHLVMARLGGPVDDPGPGHVMKARYTPAQVRVLAVEEEGSPHRAAVAACRDLAGMPVVCAELHSMVPLVAAAARAVADRLRVAYVLTDGGALPLAFSRLAAEMRAAGLLAGTVTAGQAFGGDLEAISLYSALAAARAVLGADVTVVAQGPGGMGSGTALGFSGTQVAEAVNAAAALGGRPVACLRLSGADPRERHRGASHHSLTSLGRLALARAAVAVPRLADPALAELVDRQLADAGVAGRHELVPVATPDPAKLLAAWGLEVTSMGRGPDQDPAFFAAAAAAGTLAGRMALEGSGEPGTGAPEDQGGGA